MERMNRLIRLLLLAMVAIIAPLGTTSGIAAAQGTPTAGDVYVSELSGIEIEVTGDVTITDTTLEQYEHGEGELVFIESEWGQFQASFFDDTDDPETTVSLFNDGLSASAESFEVIDQGVDGEVAWSVAEVTIQGLDAVYYNQVTPDVVGNVDLMESVLAPQEEFLDEVEIAQDSIFIDGDPMFVDVDTRELEDTLLGGAATVEDDEDATAVPEDDDVTTGIGAGTDEDDVSTGTGEVFVSEVSGLEVEYIEPFVLGDAQVYGSGANAEESVTFHGELSNVTVGFFMGDDAEQSLDEFLGGFDGSAESRDEIESGYENGVAWTFSEAILGDGTDAMMYIEIREDLSSDFLILQGLIGEADAFYDEFDLAQQSFQFEGEHFFQDMTASDLEALASDSTAVETTPEAGVDEEEVTPAAESGDDERDEASSRRDRARIPGGNETETGTVEPETGFEDAGLVSGNEYLSPQFDTEVVWDDTWFVDMDDEDSVVSDVTGNMDSLFLIWDGADFAMIFIDISAADGLTPDDFVDYWVSDEFMIENADRNAEILLEDSTGDSGAIIMADYLDAGDEVVIAKEAIALDDGETIAVVTLIGFPDSFADTYDDADADIEIDDVSAFNVFRPREVDNILGN